MKRTFLLGAIFLHAFAADMHADVLNNWTTNQITTNSFGLHHVVYGNGRYVAVGEKGDGGGIYTSEDGLHWVLRFSDNNSWGLSLNYSEGHFGGIGGFNTVDVSTNGINWSSSFFPSGLYTFNYAGNAVTYGKGLYVAVGDTNGVGNILTSPDGATWTPRSIFPSAGGRISSVVYSPNFEMFIALGNNDGSEYVSWDGEFWDRYDIPGGNKISYDNGLFIVPLNNKTNLVSGDGVNWDIKLTGLTNTLGMVTYGNGLFMAQCGFSISGSYLATSTDGTNWIQYAKPLPNSISADVSLATDGTRLVSVGAGLNYSGSPNSYNGFIYTSDTLVGICMTNNPFPKIIISGLVGRNYQIQSADTLTVGKNWSTNATFELANTPFVWTDATATNSQRFYRGVLLP